MHHARTCVCACCGLGQDSAVELRSALHRPVCARCYLHRDDEASKHRDHVGMFRHALGEAQDEVMLARGERDFYRERSVATAKAVSALTGALSELHRQHSGTGAWCSCGAADCQVRRVVSDPKVGRLLGTYDEERHTYLELRRANPRKVAAEWDYVDVTLVYPPPRPAGRHRAAG